MTDCLQQIDNMALITEAKEALGGEEHFVPPEYAAKAQMIYTQVGLPPLSGSSIWDIFSTMLPLMLMGN
jgi:hypothetical protein